MADNVIGRGTIELVADARKLKAGIEDAKKSVRTLGEGQKEISRSAQRSIDRYIERLQVQNQTLGKSARETELFKLAVRGASNEQLNAASAALKSIERHKQWQGVADNVESAFRKISTAALAAAAAYATLTLRNINFADKLGDISKSTNISVEDLAGLSLLAKQTGTDLDGVAKAINRMSVEIGKSPEEFAALGITAKDNLGAFKQLSDLFNNLTDVQQRNALAQKVFGKSWQELAPILREGSARIGETIERGKQLSGITKEMQERADEFNDKVAELTISFAALGSEAVPTLTRIVKELLAAKQAANGLPGTIAGLLLVGGDQASDPAAAISDIDQKLVKLRKTADEFAAMGSFKRLFSADDIAIVNTQIAALEKQRDVLSRLQAQTPPPQPQGGETDAQRAAREAAQRAAAARAARFLRDPNKQASAEDNLRGELAAQLAFDLEQIKKASDAQLNTFSNAQRILQAMKAADLVQDRDYYAAKLGFIQLNSREQEAALTKQIERLQQETFTGKTATKDRIDNERKIADLVAQRSKVQEDAAANTRINSIEEEAANRKIAQSYADASAAAQAYIETIKRRNDRELAGIGRGNRFREDQAGVSEIEDRLLQARQKLESELRRNQITREQFDTYLKIAQETYEKEIDLYLVRTEAIRKAEGDWINGAREALNNYIDETRNVAKQVEDLFTDAFKGAEDALVEFAKTGKLDDLKSLIDQIHTDLLRLSIRQSITGPLAEILLGKPRVMTAGLQGPTADGGNLVDPLSGNPLAMIARLFGLGGGGGILGGAGGAGAATANTSLISLSTTSATTSAAMGTLTAAASAAAAALSTVAATSGISGASGLLDMSGFDFSDALTVFDSFATGTPYVPRTGPYMLHEGERVVPKADNQGGGWGGGVTVNINVPSGTSRQTFSQYATEAMRAAGRETARNS